MKTMIGTAAAALAVLLPAVADAQPRAVQRNGCTNCHASQEGGRGSSMSFPELARKYGSLGEDQLVKQLKDGSTNHPPIRGNEAQTREIIQWMLTLK